MNWNFELPSPEHLDAPGMDAGFAETRRPRQGDRRAGPQLPGHRDRHLIKDANGKPLFTGTTQIYEPEAESKGSD